jgi:hypothetical protein
MPSLYFNNAQLPATTGSSLGATEGDPIVQQTIAALEKISETKLDLVAPDLTAVLEGFIPVCAMSCLDSQSLMVYGLTRSKQQICLLPISLYTSCKASTSF